MAKSSKKKTAADPNERVISENRKALYNYQVLDALECGVILQGSEVKSLREGRISLDESYARVKDDEVWLIGCDIPEYIDANRFNHRPKRLRKLLMHRREIKRFAERATEKGLTLCRCGSISRKARPSCSWGSARARPSTTNVKP